MSSPASTPDDRHAQGMKIRRQILGDAHVDRAAAASTPFDADFQKFITETAWGSVWSRPGLDQRTRHLITIAIIAALGREQELALHIRSIRNSGATLEELREVFFHVAAYAGIPAANAAFALAKSIHDPKPPAGSTHA
jgi:4-carboxymuconolactone decarboxylase